MPYDEKLAERVRRVLPPSTNIDERKMFGGVAFLLDGKMFAGVANKDLMLRVGAEAYEAALKRPHARPMDFTGRPLTGYIYVAPAGLRTDEATSVWVTQALEFVRTVPAKKKKKAAKPRPRLKQKRR